MTRLSFATIEDSLAHLATIPTDDYQGLRAVPAAWGELVRTDRDTLPRLYERYFATVSHLLGQPSGEPASEGPPLDGPPLEGINAYRFVLAFSSSGYLGARRGEAWQLLEQRHPEHRALIEAALLRPDLPFTDAPLPSRTGTWGDLVGAMLELYRHHAPYSGEADHLASEMSTLVPGFFRRFPDQQGTMLIGLLKRHPDVVREVAELIRFSTLERGEMSAGPMESLAIDMLGFHAGRDEPLHQRGSEILAEALRDAAEWPEATVDAFVERFVRYPLRIETITQDEAAASQRNTVAWARRNVESKEPGTDARASAERSLASGERELRLIESDFAAWNAGKRRSAVQRVAVSPGTRKTLTAAARKLPAAHASFVQDLLDEAAEYRSRPKRFPMPSPADKRFADFGLKLLVIEELMYRQGVLEPRFDVHEFAREYDKREISVEDDGYEPIPEVARYFRSLHIPDELLAMVETLHQSSGLTDGLEFMAQLHPFWDPGMGDEPIPVTPKAVADLDLLPKLTSISGLEHSTPAPKLRKALADRGITLLPEDDPRAVTSG